jgi:hypothetical protein
MSYDKCCDKLRLLRPDNRRYYAWVSMPKYLKVHLPFDPIAGKTRTDEEETGRWGTIVCSSTMQPAWNIGT